MSEAADKYIEEHYPDADKTTKFMLALAFLDGALYQAKRLGEVDEKHYPENI